ncbi:sensor domain-containing diguanylate cyclase [Aliikangiella coralliicola]|uniref:diguanylate cyclase n=1 Tax=Aliikangiella coralliicola TaxID=2592383 RepID=A0A545UDU3_9GAMM|nr:sensor domain-containing diguanylate cyclase [Aliikangiella coralliicola]TQV87635.1 diguanylate cyclase [Aliikangiella coralliicola]
MKNDMADSFHCLFQLIEDCIYIHDFEGKFIEVNKAVEKTYGYPHDYFIGKTPADFAVPGYNDLKQIRQYWEKCIDGQPQRFEFWTQTCDGVIFPKEVIINQGVYAGEKVIIAVARDMTNRKRLEENLRKHAEYDSLTGLYNRRVFFELAQKAIAYSKRYEQSLTVLVFDIDHFKNINDLYGHPAGDKVLADFGKFCLSCARESDILARIGGEEFAIVMPNTDLAQVTLWTQKFFDELSKLEIQLDQKKVSVSVSVGIASLSNENSDFNDLIKAADHALYDAKKSGRNCYRFAGLSAVNA